MHVKCTSSTFRHKWASTQSRLSLVQSKRSRSLLNPFSPALVHRNSLHQNDCRGLHAFYIPQQRVVWNGSVWQWIFGVKRMASGTRVWVDAGCIRTPLWSVCGWWCWINTFPELLCCFHEWETLPHLMFGGTDDRITSCRERRRSTPWGNNTTDEILSIKYGYFITQPFWYLRFIERYLLCLISAPSGRVGNRAAPPQWFLISESVRFLNTRKYGTILLLNGWCNKPQ